MTADVHTTAHTHAPQRRGRAVRTAVLDMTIGLVGERGYAFSVDEVAELAGVHKTTIYRNWSTKAVLVADAIDRLATVEVTARRTTDPVADLRTLTLGVAKALRTPAGAQAIRAVVAASADDPELIDVARRFLAGRYQLAVDIIESAVRSGVFRPDVDPLLMWQAIVNPLHLRSILGDPGSDGVARSLVDLVIRGAAAS